MPSYTTADIRNIALLGHAGSGKTSLAEALLQEAGAIHHRGLVEKGTTISDFTDEEKAHGHSIFASILHADYQGKRLHLIDTPGYADFSGAAIAPLAAVETAAIVINAAAGVEPNARKMFERAGQRGLCRFLIINKVDHDNIDLAALLQNIRTMLGSICLPINLPTDQGRSVIDCFFNDQGESDLGPVAQFHQKIVEQVVEMDEALMEKYLEQGSVPADQLRSPLMKALREGHLVPICFVAARIGAEPSRSVGIRQLLDAFVHLAPSPLEANPPRLLRRQDPQHEEVLLSPDPARRAIAHVFQINIDPFVGKLSVFRVLQGTIRSGAQLFVSDPQAGELRKPARVTHLFAFQGKDHPEVSEAIPGDIVAVAKIDELHRDVILHESHDDDGLHPQPLTFPEPMFGLAVSAKSRGDEQKISEVLAKLVEEDPTFKVVRDSSTHETVIYGLGDLHLRVILERMKNRYKLEVDTKPPKIAYRETIAVPTEGHHRHKKQTGGAGQFGEVFLRVIPLDRGKGFEFIDDTFGGNPPKQFLPAIEKGVRQVMAEGCIAGYPMQDIRVEVYDGKHHEVDSKEVAFVIAGRKAFIDAVQKAKPVILEPCVNIEVTVPSRYVGDITSDLSGKRGRIQGTDVLPGDLAVIKAIVPLAEVTNYQSQLKSVTGGQGTYTIEFSHYDIVPPNIQLQIIAQYNKPKAEEE